MKLRRTMKTRRAMTAVAITTGLVLTVAGCGGGDDGDKKSDKGKSSAPSADNGEKGEGDSQEPAADQPLAEMKDGKVSAVIESARRDEGGFVTVTGKVTNTSDTIWTGLAWRGDERELKDNGGSMAGASLVDSKGKKKYLVLRDTSGRCLCTTFEGAVSRGQTVEWFAQFPAPPASTNKVNFQVGTMPPAPIEISDGE
ncbi:hypothetical protein [Streptomyces alboflavus]|uniref:hypothetical protein n=1 Tax=Streptomyces alboflavus TaxID=67267 RepID=UPI003692816A